MDKPKYPILIVEKVPTDSRELHVVEKNIVQPVGESICKMDDHATCMAIPTLNGIQLSDDYDWYITRNGNHEPLLIAVRK